MSWQRLSPYCLQHAVTGARVAKCGYIGADGVLAYRYLAYGPDRAAGWSYRAWSSGSAKHWSGTEPPIRYAQGERIEQPRPFLGRFDSAEAAKQAWDEIQKAPASSVPSTADGLSPTGNRGAER